MVGGHLCGRAYESARGRGHGRGWDVAMWMGWGRCWAWEEGWGEHVRGGFVSWRKSRGGVRRWEIGLSREKG